MVCTDVVQAVGLGFEDPTRMKYRWQTAVTRLGPPTVCVVGLQIGVTGSLR